MLLCHIVVCCGCASTSSIVKLNTFCKLHLLETLVIQLLRELRMRVLCPLCVHTPSSVHNSTNQSNGDELSLYRPLVRVPFAASAQPREFY